MALASPRAVAAAETDADLVAGKQLFVKNCGSCHVLNRAGTKGTTGPNLDQAFQRAEKDGFGESAIRGVSSKQIEYPNREAGGIMPAKLVTGQDAANVAAYVASVVAQPGKDTGLLATAVRRPRASRPSPRTARCRSTPTPAASCSSPPPRPPRPRGKITIKFANKSGVDHNIAIDGKGKSRSPPTAARPSPRPTRPAPTPTTARCPATSRPAWWARSTVK